MLLKYSQTCRVTSSNYYFYYNNGNYYHFCRAWIFETKRCVFCGADDDELFRRRLIKNETSSVTRNTVSPWGQRATRAYLVCPSSVATRVWRRPTNRGNRYTAFRRCARARVYFTHSTSTRWMRKIRFSGRERCFCKTRGVCRQKSVFILPARAFPATSDYRKYGTHRSRVTDMRIVRIFTSVPSVTRTSSAMVCAANSETRRCTRHFKHRRACM